MGQESDLSKSVTQNQVQWLTPAIPARQETQMRTPGSHVCWSTAVIPDTSEVEMGRLYVQDQSGKKLARPPISTNKPDVVKFPCDPNCAGAYIGRLWSRQK
jgi:lipoprotein-anchoring transpeptidase ErfK/SrfK